MIDQLAAELGRHYVAGNLEALELDERLGRLYAGDADPGVALEGLPALEPAAPAAVKSRKGWWRPRHGESDGPRPDWVPTAERFLDPTTDRLMRVWLDPATRTRHYLAEPAG